MSSIWLLINFWTLLIFNAMTIKDFRKVEGLAKIIQVYSTKAQDLTDSMKSSKFEEVLISSVKELFDYVETLKTLAPDQKTVDLAFMARVEAGEEVGVCESCQG